MKKELATGLTAVLLAAGTASASFIPIDLSQFVNSRMQTRIATAPEGNVVLGGIPFNIPSGGNNEWTAAGVGENFDRQFDGVYTIDIPIGVYGVTTAYTLANTYWGYQGDSRMKVEFFGSSGAYYGRVLLGNSDIRDWNAYPAYTTTINDITTVNVFELANGRDNNPDYLDMQIYDLPMIFLNQELTTIRITDDRFAGLHSGILSGITISQVPEPATMFLFGTGIIGVAVSRIRRRKSRTTRHLNLQQ